MRLPNLRRAVVALLVISMVTGTGPPLIAQFVAGAGFTAAASEADHTEHCNPASTGQHLRGCEHASQCILICCGSLVVAAPVLVAPQADDETDILSDRTPIRLLRGTVRARSPPEGSLPG